MVIRAAWPVFTLITVLAMIGLLMTGAYILKGIGSTLYGPVNPKWIGHRLEISPREVLAIAPLMALLIIIGVWPEWLVRVINETVTRLLA
jgi:NADH-quinone oxidoreductase subunit M